ncbi:hypothetical protein CEXT_188561 [Caerostris extrusa]|uniref:Ribosomal protein L15 n=1 Tax=Caerostris extrusa TaxID=172846 RepID=A0AAV4U9Z3_CAEEX|nr:hypothetical protein CEXT_188561 [Caerostris extrusa]
MGTCIMCASRIPEKRISVDPSRKRAVADLETRRPYSSLRTDAHHHWLLLHFVRTFQWFESRTHGTGLHRTSRSGKSVALNRRRGTPGKFYPVRKRVTSCCALYF